MSGLAIPAAIERIIQLLSALYSIGKARRETLLNKYALPIIENLTLVHNDYITAFETLLETPENQILNDADGYIHRLSILRERYLVDRKRLRQELTRWHDKPVSKDPVLTEFINKCCLYFSTRPDFQYDAPSLVDWSKDHYMSSLDSHFRAIIQQFLAECTNDKDILSLIQSIKKHKAIILSNLDYIKSAYHSCCYAFDNFRYEASRP